MAETKSALWAVFCFSDAPYIAESQWTLLGVFSSESAAEAGARRHRAFAQQDDSHSFLLPDCQTMIARVLLDEYREVGNSWNADAMEY